MTYNDMHIHKIVKKMTPLVIEVKEAYESKEKPGQEKLDYFDEEIMTIGEWLPIAEAEIKQIDNRPPELDDLLNKTQLVLADVLNTLTLLIIRQSGALVLPQN